jgi:flagellar export protein FliJ
MKPHSLETLARLRKQELMALNADMVAVQARQDALLESLQKLEVEIATEAAIATGEPFAQFGAYSLGHRARTNRVMHDLDSIDAEISELHDLIATAFEAYKIIDQVQITQSLEQQALLKRFEQAALDDIAGRQAIGQN